MQKLFEYITQSCDGGLRDEYTERLHMKNK